MFCVCLLCVFLLAFSLFSDFCKTTNGFFFVSLDTKQIHYLNLISEKGCITVPGTTVTHPSPATWFNDLHVIYQFWDTGFPGSAWVTETAKKPTFKHRRQLCGNLHKHQCFYSHLHDICTCLKLFFYFQKKSATALRFMYNKKKMMNVIKALYLFQRRHTVGIHMNYYYQQSKKLMDYVYICSSSVTWIITEGESKPIRDLLKELWGIEA